MSPSVGNFVHDLVEMAKAMETLPQVQEALRYTENANRELLDRIQSLELKLIDRASEIDALHAKIREAEQARDQAETMFLEETDRTASFKSFVENLFGTAGNLLKAAAPPAPMAIPEVEQVQEPARLSEPDLAWDIDRPYNKPNEVTPQTEVPVWSRYNEPVVHGTLNIDSQSTGPGESAADPTGVTTPASSEPLTGEVAGSIPASTVESASTEPPTGPYAGKWYSDHPDYVSLYDWVAGGGSEETYYRFRPMSA